MDYRQRFKIHVKGNNFLIYLLTAKNNSSFTFVNENLSFFRKYNDSITISSNTAKLTRLYQIVKAYFIENYVDDIKPKGKFNIRLLGICLKNMFRKKYSLTSIKDFYFEVNNISIDGVYFWGLLIKKIVKRASFLFLSYSP